MGESSVQDQLFCGHQLSGRVQVTQKLDLDQMPEGSIHILKDTNMIKLTFCLGFICFVFDPVWTILMIFVICHKLWGIKCPRNFWQPLWMLPFISLFLLLHVTVTRLVRPCDAFGLKARVNKKGKFPPCGVGKVPPRIIYVWGNSSTLKIYFSLCVTVWMFSAEK